MNAPLMLPLGFPPRLYFHVDTPLVLLTALLIALGLVLVASSAVGASAVLDVPTQTFFMRQLVYLLPGVLGAVLVAWIPMAVWERHGGWLLAAAFLLLVLVFMPGLSRTVNGSTRWIDLGLMNLQVSEVAKVLLVLYTAGYLVRRHAEVRQKFWGIIKPLMVFAIMAVLLLLQPDFGALVVTLGALLGMIFLSGVRLLHCVVIVALALLIVVIVVEQEPYRLTRLTSFQDPFSVAYGDGYQLTQALIAFGRGEWTGVGLGHSVQKMAFLPEAHTDFVFAIAAEELGLLGSLGILLLFAGFLGRCYWVGYRARVQQQWFNAWVAWGISLLLSAQVVINLGVNTGLLPTKGLTLPFLSYGGSSLVMCCVMVGLLLRIHHETLDRARSAA